MKKTALSKYQRLEGAGLWRAGPEAQRIDAIVSVGEATLTITDMRDRVQAHWSIAAVARGAAEPGVVLYHPDGDPGETLELDDSESDLIEAIETLRAAVARRRPKRGRVRLLAGVLIAAAVLAVLWGWLPGAARQHALSVVPAVKRAEIGTALAAEIARLAGPRCDGKDGLRALEKLGRRLPPRAQERTRLVVLRGDIPGAIRLPGGIVIVGADLVERHDEPDVLAGYVIAAHLRAEAHDPLARLLEQGGARVSLRLLATGEVSGDVLRAHAAGLLRGAPAPLAPDVLMDGFAVWKVRAGPYAEAQDVDRAGRAALLEAAPQDANPPQPLLSDADWLRLQGICRL